MHNFAHDNALSSFASTLKELLPILKSECEAAINWLYNNKMTSLTPDKFQVIHLNKRGSDNTNIEVKIGNEKIQPTSSVKFLGERQTKFESSYIRLCITWLSITWTSP